MLESGRVELLANCEYVGDRRSSRASPASGSRCRERCRIVDARYLAPDIPADTPPPFEVADGARVIPVNDLAASGGGAEPVRHRGVGQDRDRRLRLAAGARRRPRRDLLGAAPRPLDAQPGRGPARSGGLPGHGRRHRCRRRPSAASLDDLFLRLEEAGVMLRIDRSVTPTMAKAPTLATWELDLLRTHRERRTPAATPRRRPGPAHLRRRLGRGRATTRSSCTARRTALKNPPLVPIWRPDGDHAAADPGRVPVLRCGARRLRRGDPRRRRRRRTGSARRRRTATPWPTGRG